MEVDHTAVQRTEPSEAAEEGYPLAEPEDAVRAGPPGVSDEERAQFLARHGAEALIEGGFTEREIDALAARYVREGGDAGVDAFIAWARSSR